MKQSLNKRIDYFVKCSNCGEIVSIYKSVIIAPDKCWCDECYSYMKNKHKYTAKYKDTLV